MQLGIDGLPDQLVPGVAAEPEGDVHEEQSDAQGGGGLPDHAAGGQVQGHPGDGQADAEHRRAVLRDDRPQRRVDGRALLAARLVQGPGQRGALGDQGDTEHDQPAV
ncbi:hypothetical protein GCM10010498_30940 [Streptomyces cavourensis]|nr:hypothetical protein GCM10010498_30940 [Streptomyces cavourensis]